MQDATAHKQAENLILRALPREDFERLAPHLEPVKLSIHQVIHKQGDSIPYLYFLSHSMISIVSNMADGSTVEVGIVGREGVGGIHALMGVNTTPNESMVQIADGAMRIKKELLEAEFKRGGALQTLLLRFIHSLMVQVSQTAACNRLHNVEERLARWLLMTRDRTDSDELPLTHEFISMMLGTRRAGVTTAALALQAENLIRYNRGHITVLDGKGLEDFACECYPIVKAEYESALNG